MLTRCPSPAALLGLPLTQACWRSRPQQRQQVSGQQEGRCGRPKRRALAKRPALRTTPLAALLPPHDKPAARPGGGQSHGPRLCPDLRHAAWAVQARTAAPSAALARRPWPSWTTQWSGRASRRPCARPSSSRVRGRAQGGGRPHPTEDEGTRSGSSQTRIACLAPPLKSFHRRFALTGVRPSPGQAPASQGRAACPPTHSCC